jgi:hypothetical protein
MLGRHARFYVLHAERATNLMCFFEGCKLKSVPAAYQHDSRLYAACPLTHACGPALRGAGARGDREPGGGRGPERCKPQTVS